MHEEFDVIVIGAGNAGIAAAKSVDDAGLSVAVIESEDFGGTCPNRGCTPKKVLVAAAECLDQISRAPQHGIKTSQTSLDWAHLIDREQAMVAHIPTAMQKFADTIATVFTGPARFVGPNEIEVSGNRLRGLDIVVATGSTPRSLPIQGAEYLVTSDDLLTNRTLPAEIVFVGGGVIALEFAHIFARAGSKVTILEALPRLLPQVDEEATDVLRSATEALGVVIVTGVSVHKISARHSQFCVNYSADEEEFELVADRIVNGTGRVPNIGDLNLDAAGVKHDGFSISIDSFFRSTTNESVWVVGDALPTTAQLSPLATLEGAAAGHYISQGVPESVEKKVTPRVIHTIPALASVGLTEQQAIEANLDFLIRVTDMTEWFSAKSYAESTAWAKVLIDKNTDLIIGAHLVGHHGADLIHLFALAMDHGITASAVKNSTFAFPTFSSDIKNL